MRHTIKYSSMFLILINLISGCNTEELVLPEQIAEEGSSESTRRPVKPDYLSFSIDYDEKVAINFGKTDTEKVEKLHLIYQSISKTDTIVISDFNEILEINDFPLAKTTDLSVFAEGKNGVLSNPYVYKIKTKPYPSRVVFEELSVIGGEGEINILWKNETKIPVNIQVNVSGEIYESGMNKLASSFLDIAKPRGTYDLKISVIDSLGKSSNTKDTTVRVISEVQIDRTNWTVTASSSYPGEGPGTPEGVLDGDLNTKWHSSYWPEDLPYPHWLMFDMKEPYLVSKIQLAPRNDNNTTGFTTFNLEGSLDGENWVILHANGTHDPAVKGLQTTILSNPANVRYLRLNMLTGGMNSTHLSEFVAYSID